MKSSKFFEGFITGISCALLALLLAGCSDITGSTTNTVVKTNSLTNTAALIVGVANSKFAGSCPGSDLDASNFASVCTVKGIKYTALVNTDGTYSTVKSKLQYLCDTYDTAIFYFSGHGGQTKSFNPYGDNESDGNNEFLCLYDVAMIDDDVWKIISKAKGRVICIFDCCHSGDMWRAPTFTDKVKFGAPIITNVVGAVNSGGIFVLSGCPDDTYSYGSTDGGQLTNTIRKYFKNQTYLSLFELVENDKVLRSYQRPVCTIINGFDGNVEFLR